MPPKKVKGNSKKGIAQSEPPHAGESVAPSLAGNRTPFNYRAGTEQPDTRNLPSVTIPRPGKRSEPVQPASSTPDDEDEDMDLDLGTVKDFNKADPVPAHNADDTDDDDESLDLGDVVLVGQAGPGPAPIVKVEPGPEPSVPTSEDHDNVIETGATTLSVTRGPWPVVDSDAPAIADIPVEMSHAVNVPAQSGPVTMSSWTQHPASNAPAWTWHPGVMPRPPVFDEMCPPGMSTEEFRNKLLQALMEQPADSMSAFILNLVASNIVDKTAGLRPADADTAISKAISVLEESKGVIWSMFPSLFRQTHGIWPPANLADAMKVAQLNMCFGDTELWRKEE